MTQLTIQEAFDRALQLHQSGRLREAEQLYRQILAQQPDHVDALNNMGVLAHQAGQYGVAIHFLRKAIVLKPADPQAINNLANSLRAVGQLDEAIQLYRKSVVLAPGYSLAHYNLANALFENREIDAALAAYGQAIVLRPDFAEAHCNLGNVLCDQRKFDDAIHAFKRSLAIRPSAQAYTNLGSALQGKAEPENAIVAHRHAIEIDSGYAEAHNHLGTALSDTGKTSDAIAAFERAIAIRPDFPQAHYNLSLALLSKGRFREGWEEYEWRWKCIDFPTKPANFDQPRWNGDPLDGRTLLLEAEQGFGDTVQFIRYVPELARRGAAIIVHCHPELERLFHGIACPCQIVPRGQPLPPFDFWTPLISLPRVFKLALESIPAQVPYLVPESNLVEPWREKLSSTSGKLNVALAWAGNPAFKADVTRSMSLDRLAPLADVNEATFFSVQKGDAGQQVREAPAGLHLIDIATELQDFADSAAILSLMDLVITTDTSVAHLAGALGLPVWVMLQYASDWRWLLDREDSPWYPSMRLFRQHAKGDWSGVIQEVIRALKNCVKN